MGLVLKEKICLRTPQGVSEVQFLFGDITQLPLAEKVDYIFTSAFPGDYTEVPGTLIGALKRNLGLRVGELARDKEMDLRRTFNCWVSKQLPGELPYRRVVCFERMNRFEKLPEQISGIFRAMMPVFNNQDTTVITPLLASGNQGHSEIMILKSIVKAACHWIKAGLPLRCLKIVLYLRNPLQVSDEDVKMLTCFTGLKKRWETDKDTKVDTIEKTFDVCLSFSEKDEQLAKAICSSLHEVDITIRIYSQHFSYNHDEVWQETIFQTMIHSKRVVAVLTPNYISDAECLEHFSLALCCNRLKSEEALAPFYVQTVDAFPSYMTLVQYTECRVRKQGEVAEQKIFLACTLLIKALDRGDQTDSKPNPEGDQKQIMGDKKKYDVFISYAHKTPVDANRVHHGLLDINPDLRIFLDKSELMTGNIWQETLYEAVDKCKCVIAFITESYLKSTVCQEEYNIALARYMSADGLYFVPVLTDPNIEDLPAEYASAPIIDMRDHLDRYNETYHLLCERVLQWIERGEVNKFVQPAKRVRIAQVSETWRHHDFSQRFLVDSNEGTVKLRQERGVTSTDKNEMKPSKSVAFSFAKDCFTYAAALSHFLMSQKDVDIQCEFLMPQKTTMEVQPPKLQLLDSADMVVVFVSDEYMSSAQHRQELHIALCRQRTTKDHPVLYLIQANHVKPQPVYPHLLHYSINLGDRLWTTTARFKIPKEQVPILVKIPGVETVTVYCQREEKLALTTAAIDIAAKVAAEPGPEGSGMLANIVNLEHLLRKGVTEKVPVSQCLVPFPSLMSSKKIQQDQASCDATHSVEPLNKEINEMNTTAAQESDIPVTPQLVQQVNKDGDRQLNQKQPVQQVEENADQQSKNQQNAKSSSACVLL